MNPIQLAQFISQILPAFEEALSIYSKLKDNGKAAQLTGAATTLISLAQDPEVQDFLSKVPTIIQHLPSPAVQATTGVTPNA